MDRYADYEFYIEEYNGSLSNDLFNSLIVKASREIDKNINMELTEEKINKLTDKEKYKFKYAVCAMIDFCNKNNSIESGTSVSIDGVSINNMSVIELKNSKREILGYLPDILTRYV